jgi:hypothetical protein
METNRFRELLPQAVDELEQRWHANKLGAAEALGFCDNLLGKLGPADVGYRDRVLAIRGLAAADPKIIEAEVAELEGLWPDFDDNYKDILEECDMLLARTKPHPELEARVTAVLASVVDEIEREAKNDESVREYLGDFGTRKHWESVIGKPLPRGRPR